MHIGVQSGRRCPMSDLFWVTILGVFYLIIFHLFFCFGIFSRIFSLLSLFTPVFSSFLIFCFPPLTLSLVQISARKGGKQVSGQSGNLPECQQKKKNKKGTRSRPFICFGSNYELHLPNRPAGSWTWYSRNCFFGLVLMPGESKEPARNS